MSCDAAVPRPRPLSGGLWTLFSWLRRDEHSSSESLSSVGSDRTAASFAFLAPAHYGFAAPASLPPPPPPTDSYKKRVRDRKLRQQHDRDITLHRKYGLYGFGYDALSLPSARRTVVAGAGDRCERDKRAASECPRAHVPGKRRAPLPPSGPASLPRRRARKRHAPLPPINPTKENIGNCVTIADLEPMNGQPLRDKRPPQTQDNAMDCKPEKYSKKDELTKETKDVKIRHEKSFLKQMFENRKRNSTIETASVKLLPNISELDKQAAEMIEKYRLKELAQSDVLDRQLGINESPSSSKQQTNAWICTRCLRKYNSSEITCDYCLPLNKVNESYRSSKVANNCTQTSSNLSKTVSRSANEEIEEKDKLKEMLKEMKDSLPKRPKNDLSLANNSKNTSDIDSKKKNSNIVEAPTLRIGSSTYKEENPVAQTSSASRFDIEVSSSQSGSQAMNKPVQKALTTIDSVKITQPIVHTDALHIVLNESKTNKNPDKVKNHSLKTLMDNPSRNIIETEKIKPSNDPKSLNIVSQTKYDINTPLKISSLLNPIYIPKMTSTVNTQTPNLLKQAELEDVKSEKSTTTIEPTAQNIVNSTVQSTSQMKSTFLNAVPNREGKRISGQKTKQDSKESASNEKKVQVHEDRKTINTEVKVNNNLVPRPPNVDGPSTSNNEHTNQHARRRGLINQLEKSIAKGDEHAAAEAAIKLAQLRLSCSVLSFSSQIVAEAFASSSSAPQNNKTSASVNETNNEKIEKVVQKSPQTNRIPVKETAHKSQSAENMVNRLHGIDIPDNEIKRISTKKETLNSTAKASDLLMPKSEPVNITQLNYEKKDEISQNPMPRETSRSKGGATKKLNEHEYAPVLVWVEDKEATRGPVQLHVRRNAVMGDLRLQAEKSLGLASHLQRWIVGRTLCSDDNTPLVSLAGPALTAPFYLCLVESDTKDPIKPQVELNELKIDEDPGNVYNDLVKLEKQALVPNAEVFECAVCIEECPPGGGVVLRECVHSFCKECLSDVVCHSEEPVVSCPAMGCRGVLEEREIRGLVSPQDYEKWLARGLAAAESSTRNAFHCRTRDCPGWALCDPGVQRFPCPVCKCTNCVPCQAIHVGETCEQHRTKLQESTSSPDASQTDEGTLVLLKTLISRGEALECPECSAIITKKWGCDWVKCSACKTEICWVTKGRRWGPAGRGDTSGGCRCGIEGKRCHPSCGYCH